METYGKYITLEALFCYSRFPFGIRIMHKSTQFENRGVNSST